MDSRRRTREEAWPASEEENDNDHPPVLSSKAVPVPPQPASGAKPASAADRARVKALLANAMQAATVAATVQFEPSSSSSFSSSSSSLPIIPPPTALKNPNKKQTVHNSIQDGISLPSDPISLQSKTISIPEQQSLSQTIIMSSQPSNQQQKKQQISEKKKKKNRQRQLRRKAASVAAASSQGQVGAEGEEAEEEEEQYQSELNENGEVIEGIHADDAAMEYEGEYVEDEHDYAYEEEEAGVKHGNGVTKAVMKYFGQRYRLWSRYDEQIRMDTEGWYSVTPEAIAKHVAQRCKCGVVLDAFCGVGGNSIQFAMTCDRVIAIDIDPTRLSMAKHNAEVYGVAHKIEFMLGDFFEIGPKLMGKVDVVFLSPPWGGPSYLNAPVFDIKEMDGMDGYEIFKLGNRISKSGSVAYMLPRNIDPQQVVEMVGDVAEVEENCVNQKVKTVTVYTGELVKMPSE